MKRALLSVAFLAASVAAVGADSSISLSANVPSSCNITAAAGGKTMSYEFPILASGAVDMSAALATTANVTCNQSVKVQLQSTSGGLVTAVPAGAAYASRIDYTAKAVFNGITDTLDTTGALPAVSTGQTMSTGGVSSAVLALTVTPKAPAKPLVGGAYADTLTVSVSATP